MVEVVLQHATPREIIGNEIIKILQVHGPLTAPKIQKHLAARGIHTTCIAIKKLLKQLEKEGQVRCVKVRQACWWYMGSPEAAIQKILGMQRESQIAEKIRQVLREASRPLTLFEIYFLTRQYKQATVESILNALAAAGEVEKQEVSAGGKNITMWRIKKT